MAKWKCEICGDEFDNFHAQGFDNKIYCPLCYFKKENQQLKDNWNKLRKWIVYNKHNENSEQHYLVVDFGTLLGKMRELEGSDKEC